MPVYKDEQRGTWYATFYATDWTGKKLRFERKKDAEEYERSYILRQYGYFDMSFSSFIEIYLKDAQTVCVCQLMKCNCI